MATPQKIVTPKNWSKNIGYPNFLLRTLLRGGLLSNFGKMAYIILYWFINAI